MSTQCAQFVDRVIKQFVESNVNWCWLTIYDVARLGWVGLLKPKVEQCCQV